MDPLVSYARICILSYALYKPPVYAKPDLCEPPLPLVSPHLLVQLRLCLGHRFLFTLSRWLVHLHLGAVLLCLCSSHLVGCGCAL